MAKKFIDLRGLSRITANIKYYIQKHLATKADKDLSNVDAVTFRRAGDSINIITTTGTGSAYKATVPGIEQLTPGVSFIMVPHVTSTTTLVTLDVNGLGEKNLRQPLTTNTGSTTTAAVASWLSANHPVRVMYNGTLWEIDVPRPSAAYLYGTVPVSAGGTGGTTVAEALNNLGFTQAVTYDVESNFSKGSILVPGAWGARHRIYIFDFYVPTAITDEVPTHNVHAQLVLHNSSFMTFNPSDLHEITLNGRQVYFAFHGSGTDSVSVEMIDPSNGGTKKEESVYLKRVYGVY